MRCDVRHEFQFSIREYHHVQVLSRTVREIGVPATFPFWFFVFERLMNILVCFAAVNLDSLIPLKSWNAKAFHVIFLTLTPRKTKFVELVELPLSQGSRALGVTRCISRIGIIRGFLC